ncbi:MAG: ABC transporter permease [Nocardioidaceae bacterium]|nr:ABC transporter permease [Nocardioidaceae bacterium]
MRGLRSTETIPTSRLIGVELQKMFNTRSGFWLLTGGALLSVVATIITVFADPDLSYGSFAAAIGAPLSIVLPMAGILAVTSEWSQRTGLTTFTLVPHRGQVIGAKLAATLLVGVTSIAIAFSVGALGNVAGSALMGQDTVWDISVGNALTIFFADGLGMLMGFMLGVLIRNSPGAIVGYFVYALVLPAAFGALAAFQDWFERIQGWVDFQFASGQLYDGGLTATEWAHLAVSGLVWLVIPLAVGLRLVVRSEVK